jgi:hypothetical protein
MTIENFLPESVKITNAGVVIKYHTSTDASIQSYENKERVPHPDFTKSLSNFCGIYRDAFELSGEYDVDVKGLNTDENQLQLTGTLTAANGSKCSLNTPKFATEHEMIQFLDDEENVDQKVMRINALIERVRNEAFNFIFSKKSAQAELDFGDDTPIQDEGTSETKYGEWGHSECKDFIKACLANNPDKAAEHFGNYTTKKTVVLQELIASYEV